MSQSLDSPPLIVGAGPAGLAAGCAAQDAGLRFVIVERAGLVQSLVEHPQQIRYFSPADELAIGGIPFPMAGGHKPTREDALAYYRAVAAARRLPLATWEEVTDVRPGRRTACSKFAPCIGWRRKAKSWSARRGFCWSAPGRSRTPGLWTSPAAICPKSS